MKDDRAIKVSVIIPVYNVAAYLPSCLDSVINQTLKEIELVCVNDGSPDNCLDILEEYAKRDSRIVIVDLKENKGLSVARNEGMARARGEYIYFMDSDDLITPDAMEKLYERVTQNQLDIVYFEGDTVFDTEKLAKENAFSIKWCVRTKAYTGVKTGKELLLEMYDNGDYKAPVWIQFIRRAFCEEAQLSFVPGLLFEDILFTIEGMLKASRVEHVFEKYYIRRVREGSITSNRRGSFRKTYGFFHSAVGLLKLSARMPLEPAVQRIVHLEVFNRLREARIKYKEMSLEEAIKYKELSPEERVDFRHLVINPVEESRKCYQVQLKLKEANEGRKKNWESFMEANAARKKNWDALMEANAARKKNWDALVEANAARKKNYEDAQAARNQLRQLNLELQAVKAELRFCKERLAKYEQ